MCFEGTLAFPSPQLIRELGALLPLMQHTSDEKTQDEVKTTAKCLVAVHEHCYERIHPNINGSVVSFPVDGKYIRPSAPAHVVVGSAGAVQAEKFATPSPPWSAARFANGVDQSAPHHDAG